MLFTYTLDQLVEGGPNESDISLNIGLISVIGCSCVFKEMIMHMFVNSRRSERAGPGQFVFKAEKNHIRYFIQKD